MVTPIAFEPPLTKVTFTRSPCSTTIGAEAAVPRYSRPLTT